MRCIPMVSAAVLMATMYFAVPAATAGERPGAAAASDMEISAQSTRRRARRARPRVTVRPLPRDLRGYHRECVPVFEERWIPQWGGLVLYARRHCWWTRG